MFTVGRSQINFFNIVFSTNYIFHNSKEVIVRGSKIKMQGSLSINKSDKDIIINDYVLIILICLSISEFISITIGILLRQYISIFFHIINKIFACNRQAVFIFICNSKCSVNRRVCRQTNYIIICASQYQFCQNTSSQTRLHH